GGLPVRHHAPSASGGRPPRWIDRPSGRLPKLRRITVSRAKRKKPHSIQFAYVSDHRDAAQSSWTKTRVHNSKICCYAPRDCSAARESSVSLLRFWREQLAPAVR